MKVRRVWAWIRLTVLLMAGSSIATWMIAMRSFMISGEAIPQSMRQSFQFQRFVSAYNLIRRKSIWHNKPNQLLLGAINGMVGMLHDQFTNYLTGGQTKGLDVLLSPTYVGVGIEVTLSKPLVIQAVFSGTSASHSGLTQGDQHRIVTMNPMAAPSLLHGPVNTPVTLTRMMRVGRGAYGSCARPYRIVRDVRAYSLSEYCRIWHNNFIS